MCDWKPDFDSLNERVNGIENRMSQVEHDVGKMRAETQDGFKQGAEAMRQIDVSVANLAHDFGDRMNTIDKRLVAEKEKWGETLRKILVWTVKVVLLGALVAMGVFTYTNVANIIFK